ncbi:hypothetical protein D4R75_00475, partial [bacterium]
MGSAFSFDPLIGFSCARHSSFLDSFISGSLSIEADFFYICPWSTLNFSSFSILVRSTRSSSLDECANWAFT